MFEMPRIADNESPRGDEGGEGAFDASSPLDVPAFLRRQSE
jgi:hypothetical protein